MVYSEKKRNNSQRDLLPVCYFVAISIDTHIPTFFRHTIIEFFRGKYINLLKMNPQYFGIIWVYISIHLIKYLLNQKDA